MINSINKILFLFFILPFGFSAFSQSFEIDPANKKDTINIIDFRGMKQRNWIVFGRSKPDTCYQRTSKVEEGVYADNRKKGIWTTYFCAGTVRSKVTFTNGRPDGYATIYHPNGKTAEEGIWKGNKWNGVYKSYFDNGQVQQEFNFTAAGKREGPQKYYYSDGKIQIEGNWQNGKENGVVTEYHPDGSIKKTVNYDNGNADVASIKEFKPKKEIAVTEVVSTKKVSATKDEEVLGEAQKGPTMLNGYHVLFNKSRQKTKEGIFKDNRLMEGKNYVFDENGILQYVEIYKNGIFAGNQYE